MLSLQDYQKIAFWPMTLLSFLFLYIFCATNFHIEIAERNRYLFSIADKIIWLVFVIDYLIMVLLSKNKYKFIRSHIPHLLVVAVPFLRLLRIGRLVLMLTNVLGMMKNKILVSIPIYIISSAALFVLIGAASIYDAEYQEPNSSIKTPKDAFWWAGALIFAYFYNETPPVTEAGRFYGFLLTLCGLSIVGTITATFAGWLISQVRQIESESELILKKLSDIEKKLQ